MSLAARIGEVQRAVVTKRSASALAEAEVLFKSGPSNDDAARVLTDFLTAFPGDSIALHHLAIHLHSRAFEIEVGSTAEFEAAFGEALACWKRVVDCEDFWSGLRARGVENGGDRFATGTVDEARERLPRWLIEFHARQVLLNRRSDEEASKLKARRHMRVILAAPFPDAVAACRGEIFQAYCEAASQYEHGGNPAESLDKAARIIEGYLTLDPKHRDAHREHLRFLGLLGRQLDDREKDYPIEVFLARLGEVVERAQVSENVLAAADGDFARTERAAALRTRALLELLQFDFEKSMRTINLALALDPDAPSALSFKEGRLQRIQEIWRDSDRKIERGDAGGYNGRLNVYRWLRAYNRARTDLKRLRARRDIDTSVIDSILREIDENQREDRLKDPD